MKAIALMSLLLLAGCMSQPVQLDSRAAWCAHNDPKVWSVATVKAMTPDERREEEAYHVKGVTWCGWDA